MNNEQTPATPEVRENEELEIEREDEVAAELPDESLELPTRLDFPNKFFQG